MRLSHPSPSHFRVLSSFCLPYTHTYTHTHTHTHTQARSTLASTGDKRTLPRINCKTHFIHSSGCLVGCWAEARPLGWGRGRGTSWRGGRRPAGATACPECGARTAPGAGGPRSHRCPCNRPSPAGTAARGSRGTGSRPTCRARGWGRARGESGTEGERDEGVAHPAGRVGLPLIPYYLDVEQSSTTLPRSSLCFLPPLDAELATSRTNYFFKFFFLMDHF